MKAQRLKLNLKNYKYYKILFFAFVLAIGCANQQPPSGGEDDKTPPKVSIITPKPNTTNFKGNKITLEFNEYIDRRSFTDALYITPKPKGEISFNWGGKDVEIEFPKGFEKDKTYLFTINKIFKDIHNNNIDKPIQFAFSTGNNIDKGSASGKVFGKVYDNIFIFAYKITDTLKTIDPSKQSPDYFIPVDNEGNFKFENLAAGIYKFISVFDNDRNGLFDKDLEYLSYSNPEFFNISDDKQVSDIYFVLKDLILTEKYYSSVSFYNTLRKDSLNFIYSNYTNGDIGVGLLSHYYFYFKNNTIDKNTLVSSFSLTDTIGNKIRYINSWMNDSLLEIIPVSDLKPNSQLKFEFNLLNTKLKYDYKLNIKLADDKKIGDLSGKVIFNANLENITVVALNKENFQYIYLQKLSNDSTFKFSGLLEGEYYLYAFIDDNKNGILDISGDSQSQKSERFIFYPNIIKIKGGWNIENVILQF